MDITNFFEALLSYLTAVPAAALCFFPMKNQLRYESKHLLRYALPVLFLSFPTLSVLTCYLKTAPNTLLAPLLTVFFFCYHKSLTVHISKSLAIFSYVCSLMSILSNFANRFDALMHPYSGADTFTMSGSVFQLALCTAATLLL